MNAAAGRSCLPRVGPEPNEPDEQTKALLRRLAEAPGEDITLMSPVRMRQQFAEFFRSVGLPPEDLTDTENRTAPGPAGEIPIRVYRPRGETTAALSAMVYDHGGGMNASSIDLYDAICQRLCHSSGAAVVPVGDRLAPEHRFPIGLADAYAAACWVYASAAELGFDASRLAIGGDSAGGYLTAVVSHMARDLGGPRFAFQVMIYAAVGRRGWSRSMGQFASGYFLQRDELDWIYGQHVNDPSELRDPRVCPILATDLSGPPTAFVVTAGFDILRDDDEHVAELLRSAGVPVEVHSYETTIHGFLSMAAVIDQGVEAIEEVASKVRAPSVQRDAMQPEPDAVPICARAPSRPRGACCVRSAYWASRLRSQSDAKRLTSDRHVPVSFAACRSGVSPRRRRQGWWRCTDSGSERIKRGQWWKETADGADVPPCGSDQSTRARQ